MGAQASPFASFVDRLQDDEDEFRMEEWMVDCLKKRYRESDSLGPQAKYANTVPAHGLSTVMQLRRRCIVTAHVRKLWSNLWRATLAFL